MLLIFSKHGIVNPERIILSTAVKPFINQTKTHYVNFSICGGLIDSFTLADALAYDSALACILCMVHSLLQFHLWVSSERAGKLFKNTFAA
jgi:hypothetical protein